jgi:hypothetical protein
MYPAQRARLALIWGLASLLTSNWIENRSRRRFIGKARRRSKNMLIRVEVVRSKNYI